MSDLAHIESVVGPLPRGRAVETAQVSTYRSALTGLRRVFEPTAAEFRAALDEAYGRLERVAEALPAHEWDDEWGVHYKVKLVPEPELGRIEAEARKLVAALFTELDEEEATDVILAAFPHGAPAWVLAHDDAEHGGEA